MNNIQKEILEGLILSDGYIGMSSTKSKNPRFIIPSIHKQFIDYLSNTFSFNNQKVFQYNNNSTTRNNKTRYQLNSNSTKDLWEFYSRWYVNSIKVIPSDFKLTPLTTLFIYLGDGCISIRKNYPNQAELKLCTENFTKEEVEYLQSLFIEKNINFKLQKRKMKDKIGYRLYISKRQEILKFFNYVSKLPPELDCFRYKFKYC